jgi:hypothetical protein
MALQKAVTTRLKSLREMLTVTETLTALETVLFYGSIINVGVSKNRIYKKR